MTEQNKISNNNFKPRYKKEKQNRLGIAGESGKGRTKSRNKFGYNRNNTIHSVDRESSTKYEAFKKVNTPPQEVIIPSDDPT